jgi:hypothetical protein
MCTSPQPLRWEIGSRQNLSRRTVGSGHREPLLTLHPRTQSRWPLIWMAQSRSTPPKTPSSNSVRVRRLQFTGPSSEASLDRRTHNIQCHVFFFRIPAHNTPTTTQPLECRACTVRCYCDLPCEHEHRGAHFTRCGIRGCASPRRVSDLATNHTHAPPRTTHTVFC